MQLVKLIILSGWKISKRNSTQFTEGNTPTNETSHYALKETRLPYPPVHYALKETRLPMKQYTMH